MPSESKNLLHTICAFTHTTQIYLFQCVATNQDCTENASDMWHFLCRGEVWMYEPILYVYCTTGDRWKWWAAEFYVTACNAIGKSTLIHHYLVHTYLNTILIINNGIGMYILTSTSMYVYSYRRYKYIVEVFVDYYELATRHLL